jgi:hypothetical protein
MTEDTKRLKKGEEDNIVLKVIDSIFDYISRKEGETKTAERLRNGMTLFVHNLGRFDGIPIFKGLVNVAPDKNKYEVKGT